VVSSPIKVHKLSKLLVPGCTVRGKDNRGIYGGI